MRGVFVPVWFPMTQKVILVVGDDDVDDETAARKMGRTCMTDLRKFVSHGERKEGINL